MQRIIQINIAGRLIPIEEDAYLMLKDYIAALERQFAGEEGNDEIISDIESRIAELFSIRLDAGAHSIVRSDVAKVIETLGPASELNEGSSPYTKIKSMVPYEPAQKQKANNQNYNRNSYTSPRIYRNPNDKIFGGVCGGLAAYFDIDPAIIRIITVSLFFAGVGVIAYFIAWAVIPLARTPEELNNMTGGEPMTFHDISRNVQTELKDLKKRGEEMSRELKDFFSKKK